VTKIHSSGIEDKLQGACLSAGPLSCGEGGLKLPAALQSLLGAGLMLLFRAARPFFGDTGLMEFACGQKLNQSPATCQERDEDIPERLIGSSAQCIETGLCLEVASNWKIGPWRVSMPDCFTRTAALCLLLRLFGPGTWFVVHAGVSGVSKRSWHWWLQLDDMVISELSDRGKSFPRASSGCQGFRNFLSLVNARFRGGSAGF